MTRERAAYGQGWNARYGRQQWHANPYHDFECGAAWAVGFALIKRAHLADSKRDDGLMAQARMLELAIWQ